MSFAHIDVSRDGPLATVTFNRPAVLNALNAATLDELEAALVELRDDPGVRVLILTGAGGKAFVAGADINELAEVAAAGARDLSRRGQRVFDLVERLGKPVIAAVNGYALGGGCELALACTFRLAADTARLGLPEIDLGLIPGYAGTQRLSRLLGRDRAMELILTGRHVPADEALRIGLVTRVVAAADLLDEARRLALALAAKAPLAVRLAMDAVNQGLDMTLPAACEHESALFAVAAASEDMREGTRAFLEKRKPAFKGR
jgi:enoyl-CoA hydratase